MTVSFGKLSIKKTIGIIQEKLHSQKSTKAGESLLTEYSRQSCSEQLWKKLRWFSCFAGGIFSQPGAKSLWGHTQADICPVLKQCKGLPYWWVCCYMYCPKAVKYDLGSPAGGMGLDVSDLPTKCVTIWCHITQEWAAPEELLSQVLSTHHFHQPVVPVEEVFRYRNNAFLSHKQY